MFKVHGHYVYLTIEQFDYIFDIVCGNEDIWWKGRSGLIGSKENIERNKRIQKYIENNFSEEYYKFNFYSKDAQKNIFEILSSYASLTDIIKIVRADDISYDDAFNESITGNYNIKKIKIKIYEKIFFGLFGVKDTGSSITIDIQNIEHIYGELKNFTVESKIFTVKFIIDSVNVMYK